MSQRHLDKLHEIDDDGEGLTPWELEFVSSLIDTGRTRFSYTEQEKIDQIHTERVPR